MGILSSLAKWFMLSPAQYDDLVEKMSELDQECSDRLLDNIKLSEQVTSLKESEDRHVLQVNDLQRIIEDLEANLVQKNCLIQKQMGDLEHVGKDLEAAHIWADKQQASAQEYAAQVEELAQKLAAANIEILKLKQKRKVANGKNRKAAKV